MAYPEQGATYRRMPAWIDRMKRAEDGKDTVDYSGNLMHNPATPDPGAPPSPVAPPNKRADGGATDDGGSVNNPSANKQNLIDAGVPAPMLGGVPDSVLAKGNSWLQNAKAQSKAASEGRADGGATKKGRP